MSSLTQDGVRDQIFGEVVWRIRKRNLGFPSDDCRAKTKFDGDIMGREPGSCNGYLEKNVPEPSNVLRKNMQMKTDRAVLTVLRHKGEWAVELDGELFGHSRDKEISKAAAHRRALAMQGAGRPCQVRVSGETGFYGAP